MVKANPSWVARVWTNVEIDDYIQAHIAGHDWNLIKVDEPPFSLLFVFFFSFCRARGRVGSACQARSKASRVAESGLRWLLDIPLSHTEPRCNPPNHGEARQSTLSGRPICGGCSCAPTRLTRV